MKKNEQKLSNIENLDDAHFVDDTNSEIWKSYLTFL